MKARIAAGICVVLLCAVLLSHSATAGQDPHKDKSDDGAKIVYVCAMHPKVRQKAPGECPKCGMELVVATPGEAAEAARRASPVTIEEGQLHRYCDKYFKDKLSLLENGKGSDPLTVIRAWVALRGVEAGGELRQLVEGGSLAVAGVAAYHLALMGDEETLPDMRRLWESERGSLVNTEKTTFETRRLNGYVFLLKALYILDPDYVESDIDILIKEPQGFFIMEVLELKPTSTNIERLKALYRRADTPPQRIRVAGSLVRLGQKDYISTIKEALESGKDRRQDTAALECFPLRFFPENVKDSVRNLFRKSKDIHRKLDAATNLARAGDADALDYIVGIAESGDEGAAGYAARCLAVVGNTKHLGVVEKLIEEHPRHRMDAVYAAARIYGRLHTFETTFHKSDVTDTAAAGPQIRAAGGINPAPYQARSLRHLCRGRIRPERYRGAGGAAYTEVVE